MALLSSSTASVYFPSAMYFLPLSTSLFGSLEHPQTTSIVNTIVKT